MSFGALAFLSPWILAGLVALPVLWWLLRAIPPSPRAQIFSGVRLLLGLQDEERQADKTPWWLLLLRCLAVAAALIGFAQPVMNLQSRLTGAGPILLILDGGWASAPDWAQRIAAASSALDEADQAGRDVMVAALADGNISPEMSARAAKSLIESLEPRAWAPDFDSLTEGLEQVREAIGETIWLHDGHGDEQRANRYQRWSPAQLCW